MLEFEIKAIIANVETLVKRSTIYLFNKEQRVLLPINLNNDDAQTLTLGQSWLVDGKPNPHDTVVRTIAALNGKIQSIVIYNYYSDIFYAYLRIEHDEEVLDVNAHALDAISIAIRQKLPILVTEEVYEIAGIKITPELLNEALT